LFPEEVNATEEEEEQWGSFFFVRPLIFYAVGLFTWRT
jgi:hypothetical protein